MRLAIGLVELLYLFVYVGPLGVLALLDLLVEVPLAHPRVHLGRQPAALAQRLPERGDRRQDAVDGLGGVALARQELGGEPTGLPAVDVAGEHDLREGFL